MESLNELQDDLLTELFNQGMSKAAVSPAFNKNFRGDEMNNSIFQLYEEDFDLTIW
jgi:hypothetical protein